MSDFFREQYQDVRWQKKKYEVMEERHWTCEWCGAKNRQLRVHHGYYERGLAVWDIPNDCLYCLCGPCNYKADTRKRNAQRALARIHPKHLSDCTRRLGTFKQGIDDKELDKSPAPIVPLFAKDK